MDSSLVKPIRNKLNCGLVFDEFFKYSEPYFKLVFPLERIFNDLIAHDINRTEIGYEYSGNILTNIVNLNEYFNKSSI